MDTLDRHSLQNCSWCQRRKRDRHSIVDAFRKVSTFFWKGNIGWKMLQLASWVGAGVSTYVSLVSCKLFSLLTQKLFFGKHLKECVAKRYRIFPVASKPQARKTSWIHYLHYGASYASETGGVLKEGSSWMQRTKNQCSNTKTLFLASIWNPSPNRHRFAAPTVVREYLVDSDWATKWMGWLWTIWTCTDVDLVHKNSKTSRVPYLGLDLSIFQNILI